MIEQGKPPIRVVLAEDHKIVRQGLRSLLDPRDDIVVVGEAENGREAVALAREHTPDVVVMDLGMPELNGVEATIEIKKEVPSCRVLILSMHSSEEQVRAAIRAGAGGFLVKGSGLSDLVAAIQALASGNAFFSPDVAGVVLSGSRDSAAEPGYQQLTKREEEVLKMVGEGSSSPEIAELLGLSVKTIEGHRRRLMDKLGANNVAGLVRAAIRMGLVSPDI